MMEYMYKSMRRLRKEDSGFTLIELLIVILILGILAGIAIFASGPFRTAAADACELANDRIDIVANAAEDAGIDRGAMFEAERGDCEGSSGGGGGGGGGLTATFVAGVTGGAAGVSVSATDSELLVGIVTHRSIDSDAAFPGIPTEGDWQFRGVASFKTAGSTADRRAVAVFTRVATGTAADNFNPTWSGATIVNTAVQRYTVSSAPSSFTFEETKGGATTVPSLALTPASGGSGNSLMVVGATMRDGTGISWSGASNATQATAGNMTSSLASATVTGAGPHGATANVTPNGHVSGFVLVIR